MLTNMYCIESTHHSKLKLSHIKYLKSIWLMRLILVPVLLSLALFVLSVSSLNKKYQLIVYFVSGDSAVCWDY